MFLSTSETWSFGAPSAGPGGTGEIYRQVIQQLGLTVFVPLFVGEVVQWLIPVFVKKWRLKLKLAKFASLCLLGVIWSTFCNAFWSGAFEELSTPTVRPASLVSADAITNASLPPTSSDPPRPVCQHPPLHRILGLPVSRRSHPPDAALPPVVAPAAPSAAFVGQGRRRRGARRKRLVGGEEAHGRTDDCRPSLLRSGQRSVK